MQRHGESFSVMRYIITLFFSHLLVLTSGFAVVDVYVETLNFASPYYKFYSDSNKTIEYDFFGGTDTLNVNQSYRFFRENTATGHPFFISDDQANASSLNSGKGPSSDISLTGNGSYTSGIGANQELTLSFNSGFDVGSDKLYYYCTSHPSMVGQFTVVPEPAAYALLVGGLALVVAISRRRRKSRQGFLA
ncbi:MAG: PEP-CTERM sorting domain-containing protein [Opitutales bacterium]